MFLITFAASNKKPMYQALTFFHSVFRWLVLISLVYSIYRGYRGYRSNAIFSKTDDGVRHWTATICHLQLMIGIFLYSQSHIVNYFWHNTKEADWDTVFFGIVHILMMLLAIVLITIGSAKAKRMPTDKEKFKTMFMWYSVGILIILVAIPWPFSPLASRPYFR